MAKKWASLFFLALLFAPKLARGQPDLDGRPTPVRRARRGGKGSKSADGGSGVVAPMQGDLPCPKGFTAQIDPGPHLRIPERAATKVRRRKASRAGDGSSLEAKNTPARRCVPDAKAKAPVDDGINPDE